MPPRARILLSLVLVVLILIAGYAVVSLASLSGDLDLARAKLNAAASAAQKSGFAISEAEVGAINANLAAADAALSNAADQLHHDPFILIVGLLPVVGNQVTAAETMVEAARLITRRHDEAFGLLKGFIAARDSGMGERRIAALAGFVAVEGRSIDDLIEGFQEADRLVSALPSSGLFGPVAAGKAWLDARFEQARPAIAAAKQAAAIIPPLLGIGGQKRYLVFALDSAEIRPMGGLIVAFATPRLRDGLVGETTFRDIGAVDHRDQKVYVRPPQGLEDHLLGEFTWQVADASWWPDFATSVAAARNMYKVETGDADFQGVIAFTPDFVDELLMVVGPVYVPEAAVTVHPGETYLLSLEQVEVLNRGEGRKAFLANLASQVLDRLFALPPSRYPDVVAALAHAGERRQLQMLFDDKSTQELVDSIGWSGSFKFPAAGDRLAIMEANVAPVSKLDALLALDHSLDVEIQTDGSATEHLVTTYTNRYGPVLSPELERVRSTFAFGNLGSYSRRYLAPDADVTSVIGDSADAPITDPDSVEPELGCLAVGNYQFVRPGIVHLTTDYTVPNIVERAVPGSGRGHIYRLQFRKQAGRDHDGLTVRVTVPDGMRAISWSPGGLLAGKTITFAVTTEFDHTFEVEFGS